MKQSPLVVNNVSVEPGTHKEVLLNVGRLPSDTRINIKLKVFHARKPGPSLLVLAGIHGDEINGVEIVRRALAKGLFENLDCGSVIAIPLLNVYGFINFSREVPDGKDVNRSFPGSQSGSLASRVARALTKKVLPLVDCGVDFHTGGSNNYNYPQIRYSLGDGSAEALARAFQPPIILGNKPISKSLRKVSRDQGKPILVYEGGENARFDGFAIERGLRGLQNLLAHLGLKSGVAAGDSSIAFDRSSWLRASRAGIFEWSKSSGQWVRKGEPIGRISDPYGDRTVPVISKRAGFIIGHNNSPVVSTGDALFHIAYEE